VSDDGVATADATAAAADGTADAEENVAVEGDAGCSTEDCTVEGVDDAPDTVSPGDARGTMPAGTAPKKGTGEAAARI